MKNFNSRMTSGGFVMYSKEVAQLISTEAAIVFGELVSWSEMKIDQEDYIEIDGKPFFMFEMDEMELETGLTERRIRPVIKKLIELKLIEKVRTGRQAQNHFHIVEDTLYNMLKEYEGTRRQRLKKIMADRRKKAKAAAKAEKPAKVAKAPRKARKKPVKAAKPVEAAPEAPEAPAASRIDEMIPAAGGLVGIIRDDQLGAIYEYIEVNYNKHQELTADEIAEICLYIREHTDYKEFNPMDIDQAFIELAKKEPSQVSKATHFLGAAIAGAAARRKIVGIAKNSEAAGNISRAELAEHLRKTDPNHPIVRRYDEEMKVFKS